MTLNSGSKLTEYLTAVTVPPTDTTQKEELWRYLRPFGKVLQKSIFRSGFIFTFTSVSYFLVFFFFSFLLFSDLYFFYSLLFIFLCLLALFSLVHMRKLSCYLPFFSLLIFHIPSVSLEKMSLSYFMFICAFLIRQTNESFTIFSVVPRQLWPLHCGNTHLKPTDHCSVYPSSPQSVSWMDVHESGVLWLHHRSVIL